MKSNVIHITESLESRGAALKQADLVSDFCGLPHKNALHLRLLTEEMWGMFRELTEESQAEFWIENQGMAFELHLVTRTSIDLNKRERLLSASSSGKNADARGLVGKLRDVFARYAEALAEQDDHLAWYYDAGRMDPESAAVTAAVVDWSMRKYKTYVENESALHNPTAEEAWDELERSIIGQLSDEVTIGIRGNRVEMVVYREFPDPAA